MAKQPAYGADPGRYQYIPRVLLVVRHAGRVLLLQRAAHKRLWPGKYNAPGGHVELGEDPYAAGLRELEEETGLRAESLQLRGLIVAETGLRTSGVLVFVYEASVIDPTLRAGNEGEPAWLRREELASLDLLPDLPQLLALTLDQPDFFYMYKIPDDHGGEKVRVRLAPKP